MRRASTTLGKAVVCTVSSLKGQNHRPSNCTNNYLKPEWAQPGIPEWQTSIVMKKNQCHLIGINADGVGAIAIVGLCCTFQCHSNSTNAEHHQLLLGLTWTELYTFFSCLIQEISEICTCSHSQCKVCVFQS